MKSQPKASSKWGTFFQQAVAGVESRLDTILAEDERPSVRSVNQFSTTDHEGPNASEKLLDSVALSKSDASGNNEGLQERLAKAVGSRSQFKPSPFSQHGKSRTSSPVQPSNSHEPISKDKEQAIEERQFKTDTHDEEDAPGELRVDVSSDGQGDNTIRHSSATVTAEESSTSDAHIRSNNARSLHRAHIPTQHETHPSHLNLADYEDSVEQGRAEFEAIERQQSDDAANFLERIESLQAKLKFLAQDLLKDAVSTMNKPESSELQRQLAQKDEKIALLVQEGTQLSQNEVKLLSNNKKLRAKIIELERASVVMAQADMISRTESKVLKEKVESLEKGERHSAQIEESMSSLKAEIHRLLKQSETKDYQISELRNQAENSMSSATLEEVEKWKGRISTERKRVSDLEEELSNLRLEKDDVVNRSTLQIHELETKLDYESKTKKKVENDLQGEIQSLESRLESMRAHAEENSSEISYDIQAKLVRQIETLQSSYTVANENWRGIESSLMSRITILEREQAETGKREIDSRRRTREGTARCRELEARLAQETTRTQDLEELVGQQADELTLLRKTLVRGESDLLAAQQQLVSLKQEQQVQTQAITAEGEAASTYAKLSEPNITNALVRTTMSQDSTAHTSHSTASPGIGPCNSSFSFSDHGPMKSPLAQSRNLSYAYDSDVLTPQFLSRQSSSGLFSTRQDHSEDIFDGAVTPATPERTINDVFSTSTAAAGPSVQLVERMSAAMRRLESEKAASKDEIDHLARQRDEAREQVTAMMTELTGKRAVEERVHKLEAESRDLSLRLQTTLEMLGEKSELVEELKADIADMKDIYRTTLEDTVK